MTIAKVVFAAFVGLCSLTLASTSAAQSDGKPIRMIVPFAPGGQVDLVARLVSEHLAQRLKVNIVVDNRAGASGLIGMKVALSASPVNTLVMGSASTLALLPHASSRAPYNPVRDFTPVSLVSTSPYVLVVQSSSSHKTLKDLIEAAKSGVKLTFGSAGSMSGTRVSTELFKTMAGIDAVHVPYKGSGPATIALLGNEVSFLINNLLPSLPHIAAGRLRPLAITTQQRNAALPNVPTVDEAGVPGYESGAWNGIVAPGKLDSTRTVALHKEIMQVLALPNVRSAIVKQGSEIIGSTPAEFSTFIMAENKKWSGIMAKIRVD